MADFLIHELAWYPWMAWLVVVLAGAGLGYVAVWAYKVQVTAFAWLGYRRLVWRSKAAVRRQLLEDPERDCELCRERDAMVLEALAPGDDPPEYEHPDGDGDELPPEPDENWIDELFPLEERRGGLYRDGDGEPYGPEAEAAEVLRRCDDPECDKYGWVHPPPCLILPTMPVPKYTTGPAMPPQPWSGLTASLEVLARGDDSPTLTGRVAAELGHDTTEAAVDSMWTRAQAAEVNQALRELER